MNTNMVKLSPNGISGRQIAKQTRFYNYILKTINYNYNYKNRGLDTYPAAQPVSIEKKDIEKLNKYDYNIGLKLDGIRYLLLLIQDNYNNNCSILINRSLEFYMIDLDLQYNDLYSNISILDGELCNNEFIIHDSVIINGHKIRNMDHNTRLGNVNEFIVNINNIELFMIKVKQFYKYSDFLKFIEIEYNTNNIKDGIIFMPVKLSVMSGTQYSLFKWKPLENHTFDFLIKENNNNLQAYVYHLKNITLFAEIHYNTDNGKLFIDKAKGLDSYKNECILECYYKEENFHPLLVRTDKKHANSLRTIERTLFNIKEDIQLKDFTTQN